MPSPGAERPLPQFPSIPNPGMDLASMHKSILALKEAVELLTGQRDLRGVTQFSVQGMLQEVQQLGSRVLELNQVGPGLAQRVELVETRVNNVSAEGQVVLRAEAAPTGYKARFGVYLRANLDTDPGTDRRAGMSLSLDNSDGAVMAFDVDKFLIRDNVSGAVNSVFSYSAGNFLLSGNVRVNGSLVVLGSITGDKLVDLTTPTAKIALNAIGQFYKTNNNGQMTADASGYSTFASVSATGVEGGYLLFVASVRAGSNDADHDASSNTTLRVLRSDGAVIREIAWSIARSASGNVVYETTTLVSFYGDASGSYTYHLQGRPALSNGPAGSFFVYWIVDEFSVEVRKR